MDGNGITQANGAGTGKVSCQKNMSPTGAFKVQEQKNGTFTIESVKYAWTEITGRVKKKISVQ